MTKVARPKVTPAVSTAVKKVAASRSRKRSTNSADYIAVLTDMKQLIADSRHRALATVNRELVCLYWNIGRVIVQQQETAQWGDAVVEQLADDLRIAFPDMTGLSSANIWRMRQFVVRFRGLAAWYAREFTPNRASGKILASALRELRPAEDSNEKLAAALRETGRDHSASPLREDEFPDELMRLMLSVSWTHHTILMGALDSVPPLFFYLSMSVRERWSVRELRRQIDAALFERYVSVKRDPEKCLPDDAESGALLPFKDHYVLEFLGLEDEHSEKQLRKAILANLRDFFLEFGKSSHHAPRDESRATHRADCVKNVKWSRHVFRTSGTHHAERDGYFGGETFYIDLLFFHRRLQCLVSIDLKKGRFKPEYIGKSQFYVAALDEQIRLPHENPSVGLILCRSANSVQVKIALSAAAKKIGIATYQTALPDLRLIQQRLEQFPVSEESLT